MICAISASVSHLSARRWDCGFAARAGPGRGWVRRCQVDVAIPSSRSALVCDQPAAINSPTSSFSAARNVSNSVACSAVIARLYLPRSRCRPARAR